MSSSRRCFPLVLLLLAAPAARAQITLTGHEGKTFHTGDVCDLEARVPSPIQPPWIWTLEGGGAHLLQSDGSGKARFLAPMVWAPTRFTVTAAYRLDTSLFRTAEIWVHPHEAFALCEKEAHLGPGCFGPRVEYLAGTHGERREGDPRWRAAPAAMAFVHDCKAPSLHRKLLRAEGRRIFAIGEDGQVATWLGGRGRGGRLVLDADGPDAPLGELGQIAVQEPPPGTPGQVRILFVEPATHRLRWADEDGQVGTLAGHPLLNGSRDGTLDEAKFLGPQGVAVGPDGTILVADTLNATIRNIRDGKVATLAGKAGHRWCADGVGPLATFFTPTVLAADPRNGDLFVLDEGAAGPLSAGHGSARVRRVTPKGEVTTLVRRDDGALAFEALDPDHPRWGKEPLGSQSLCLAQHLACWRGCLYLTFPALDRILEVDLATGAAQDLVPAVPGSTASRTGPLPAPGLDPAKCGGLRAPGAIAFNRDGGCAVATDVAVYSLCLEGLVPSEADAKAGALEWKADRKAGDAAPSSRPPHEG